jgi:hypothetical protein
MNHQAEGIANQLRSILGRSVLIPIPKGQKGPKTKGWQKLTMKDMTDAFLKKLDGMNVGVLLGPASEGLISIDCDDMKAFNKLSELNPNFVNTLKSPGYRGGNYWIRIIGDYPPGGVIRHSGVTGQDENIGEWRSTGNQTVIHGTHPKGLDYRRNGTAVLTMRFEDILWPDDWKLPWQRPVGSMRDENLDDSDVHQKKDITYPIESVRLLLESIPAGPDYNTWLKISASVRNSLGSDERALELLKNWSPEREDGEYERLLVSPFSKIHFGTLLHHAALNEFEKVVRKFFYNVTNYAMASDYAYIPLNESAVRQHLKKLCIPATYHTNILCDIREKQSVSYIGPCAGHKCGLHSANGFQILVTSGPKIVEAKHGDGGFIVQILRDLLNEEENSAQYNAFLDWLAYCRKAVLAGKRAHSPALAIAGKRGNGKSLAVEIICRCLGGRQSNAYRYLCGDTPFNKDLIGAELLVMDDPAASSHVTARIKLAQNLKGHLFSGSIRVEGKNKDAFECSPVQTVVIAVNEGAEHLKVLPEIDDSMRDKINLMKTSPVFLPSEIAGNKNLIGEQISISLPGFLHILEQRDLSKALDSRGRLKCFWHAEIVEAIGLLSPEQQLFELIHQLYEIKNLLKERKKWIGTAATLQSMLTDRQGPVFHIADKVLNWQGACGSYLSKLAANPNNGISLEGKDKLTKVQLYSIDQPEGL